MSIAERVQSMPGVARRVLAVALLLVSIVLAWLGIVQPVVDVHAMQQQWRSDAARLLAQSKTSLLALIELEQQLRAMRTSPLWSKLYVSEQAGGATTMLQSEVASLLTGAQANVQSLTPGRSTSVKGLRGISVHVSASMRIDQLQQFLAAVAAHARYLRVESLKVSAPQAQSTSDNPPLSIDLDIQAFELPESRQGVRKVQTQ
jgi:hypothetical protein